MGVYDISGNPVSDALNEPVSAGGILTHEVMLDGFLYGAGDNHFTVTTGGINQSAVYNVIPGETYKVKSENMRMRFAVGCFNTIPVDGSIPLYYEGHSGEKEFVVSIPNNALIKYMVLWFWSTAETDDSSTVFSEISVTGKAVTTLPITANYLDEALTKYADEQDALKSEYNFLTWNIGHYSMGAHKNTDVTAADYASKLKAFCKMIQQCKPDIIAVEEYSRIFATINSRDIKAEDVIFGDFKNKFIGEQRNYSCNAVFNNLPMRDIEAVDYVCNQDAEITHTSLIKATDYYYIKWNTVINGVDVLCIATHLAFDNNKPDVLQQAQINELITVCGDYPYVVIFGDFNTSNFAAFTEAGYEMVSNANIPFVTGIDNIVTKGISIVTKAKIADSNTLSDHSMFMGTMRFNFA